MLVLFGIMCALSIQRVCTCTCTHAAHTLLTSAHVQLVCVHSCTYFVHSLLCSIQAICVFHISKIKKIMRIS